MKLIRTSFARRRNIEQRVYEDERGIFLEAFFLEVRNTETLPKSALISTLFMPPTASLSRGSLGEFGSGLITSLWRLDP